MNELSKLKNCVMLLSEDEEIKAGTPRGRTPEELLKEKSEEQVSSDSKDE